MAGTNPFPKLTKLAKEGKLESRAIKELRLFLASLVIKPKKKTYDFYDERLKSEMQKGQK